MHSSLPFQRSLSVSGLCTATVVVGFLAIGCGSSAGNASGNAPGTAEPGEATSTTVVQAEVAPAEPAILTITEMRITAEGENGAIVIEADGTVVMEGVLAGKMHGDGRIDDKNGTRIATIDKDGVVAFDNLPETFTIAEDGSFTFGGRSLSIAEDGRLIGLGPEVRVLFTGPKEGRRAGMLAFVLAMTAGGPDVSTSSPPAPAGE